MARGNLKHKWVTLRVRLQNARKLIGISPGKLSMSLDFNNPAIKEYEYEDKIPSVMTLIKWADALGFDVKLIKRGKK